MFADNKYTRTYYSLIEKYSLDSTGEYVERHHIIPRALGGTDDPSNIVSLPARVHFICHRLLPRMLEGDSKRRMTLAAWTMARTRIGMRITSRVYDSLRVEASNCNSVLQKGKKREPKSEEHKRKLSESSKKRFEDPAEREKISLRMKGRTFSDETRLKMSEAKKLNPSKHVPSMAGKKHSEETKRKMKEAWARRKALA